MSVAVTSVSTADAVPLSSPYKLSAVATHNQATVAFTDTGAGRVESYRLRSGGTARNNGTYVGGLGAVCGLDVCGPGTFGLVAHRDAQCGVARVNMDQPRSTSATSPTSFTATISYSQFGAVGDGAQTINLYVRRNGAWE